jgi:hypothetical protein
MNADDSIPATKRWSNRPRLKSFSYTGAHAYHLVFNTARHEPLLIGKLAEVVVDDPDSRWGDIVRTAGVHGDAEPCAFARPRTERNGECCTTGAALQAAAGFRVQAANRTISLATELLRSRRAAR